MTIWFIPWYKRFPFYFYPILCYFGIHEYKDILRLGKNFKPLPDSFECLWCHKVKL